MLRLGDVGGDARIASVTLQELLNEDSAYINEVYVYDMIDLFLNKIDGHDPTLAHYDFAHIMRHELLIPLGMDHSGYWDTPSTQELKQTSLTTADLSVLPLHENVMLRGAGAGRTTLTDAANLVRALLRKEGLLQKNGEVLLEQEDLRDLFTSSSNFEGWALGCDVDFKGEFVSKGGCFDMDHFEFWADRASGVGYVAMSNCGRLPPEVNAFEGEVRAIMHSEQRSNRVACVDHSLSIPIVEHVKYPMQKALEYFEGTRGKVGLLFAWGAKEGVMNWSGTPLQLTQTLDDAYVIKTPGRFKDCKVSRLKGYETGQDYLTIGDTAFIKSSCEKILGTQAVQNAQEILPLLVGAYINPERPEWGTIYFAVEVVRECTFLKAKLDEKKEFVVLHIIFASETKIELTGHDWEPSDKIHCFYLEDGLWKYVCCDLVSTDLHLDYSNKISE